LPLWKAVVVEVAVARRSDHRLGRARLLSAHPAVRCKLMQKAAASGKP
jgi:hypothetical protein